MVFLSTMFLCIMTIISQFAEPVPKARIYVDSFINKCYDYNLTVINEVPWLQGMYEHTVTGEHKCSALDLGNCLRNDRGNLERWNR